MSQERQTGSRSFLRTVAGQVLYPYARSVDVVKRGYSALSILPSALAAWNRNNVLQLEAMRAAGQALKNADGRARFEERVQREGWTDEGLATRRRYLSRSKWGHLATIWLSFCMAICSLIFLTPFYGVSCAVMGGATCALLLFRVYLITIYLLQLDERNLLTAKEARTIPGFWTRF